MAIQRERIWTAVDYSGLLAPAIQVKIRNPGFAWVKCVKVAQSDFFKDAPQKIRHRISSLPDWWIREAEAKMPAVPSVTPTPTPAAPAAKKEEPARVPHPMQTPTQERDTRFSYLVARFDQLTARLDNMENTLSTRLDRVENMLRNIESVGAEIKSVVNSLRGLYPALDRMTKAHNLGTIFEEKAPQVKPHTDDDDDWDETKTVVLIGKTTQKTIKALERNFPTFEFWHFPKVSGLPQDTNVRDWCYVFVDGSVTKKGLKTLRSLEYPEPIKCEILNYAYVADELNTHLDRDEDEQEDEQEDF